MVKISDRFESVDAFSYNYLQPWLYNYQEQPPEVFYKESCS